MVIVLPWVFRGRRKGDNMYLGCYEGEERVVMCTLDVPGRRKGGSPYLGCSGGGERVVVRTLGVPGAEKGW